ncbi:HNH endonuclease signature motif containing protein [Micromonospora aurantiaca]|uniref:HNH endonuclease signature motif containing protein n=1 Tax=Micromonospora aurantiaca (nom. illeg.) TaxID=47850 RepID=UPI0034476ADA
MPRALKVCPVAGCPELVDKGRCARHRREADQRRGTAAERGYDHRWRQTRAQVLRLFPGCTEPGCDERATEVDHIDGLGPRGPRGHDLTNLRAYCKPHHSRRTARDQPGGWARR